MTQEIIELLEECRVRLDNKMYGEKITDEEFKKLENVQYYVCKALDEIK